MDFTLFEQAENIPALAWLGTKNWVEFRDYPERKAIAALPRQLKFERSRLIDPALQHLLPTEEYVVPPLGVSLAEKEKQPQAMWDAAQRLTQSLNFNHVSTIWYLMLSKALAGGPKLFRPTHEQCEALEHTEANFAFENYHQPYPVVILQIPQTYRDKLAKLYKLPHGPEFVFTYHDEDSKFISVGAFFDKKNLITSVTPARKEYKTFEDALVMGRQSKHEHGSEHEWQDTDFDAAEVVQRMAVNFTMMMTLFGVQTVGSVDPEREKKLRKNQNHPQARAQLISSMTLLDFKQTVTFYDEIQERSEPVEGGETGTHRSPKTHWRRGHWRTQHHGTGNLLVKMIYIKPVLVRADQFVGELKNTEVTYIIKPPRQP